MPKHGKDKVKVKKVHKESKEKRKSLFVHYSRKNTFDSKKADSSSSEDPDFNYIEFHKSQLEYNAKYGITAEELDQQIAKLTITTVSEYERESNSFNKGNESNWKICWRKFCCRGSKDGRVAPKEGMNEVHDRVDMNNEELKLPNDIDDAVPSTKIYPFTPRSVQNTGILTAAEPIASVATNRNRRQHHDKKVKLVGVIASVSVSNLKKVSVTK